MKRQTVIVIIHAKHCDLEISRFLNVTRSFAYKVRRSRVRVSDVNVESVAKRRKHKPRSDKVRTQQFVQQVQDIIDEDPSKSIRAISRDLLVSECSILRIIHEDIRNNSYVIRRGQFMSPQILLLHRSHDDARLDVRESA